MDISKSEVDRLFIYNPETGSLYCRVPFGRRKEGDPLGYVSNGRVVISLNNNHYLAHRIAWISLHGEIPPGKYIDHINGNPLDNSIKNLRLCTHQQNMMNRKMHKNNSTGLKGVYFDGSRSGPNKWRAQIRVEGKKVSVGRFATKEEAHSAYLKASQKYHGQFAPSSVR
ncbi:MULTISPECIES: HNH endonuclease [Enterobacter cloacae complex]|uniref:HNH endonuclease n=1 Tax=Enterobacter cloacae complex TaxID=354276 RepID=UPI00092F0A6F